MKLICLHQSSDLYGSDRSFLQVIRKLKDSQDFTSIVVCLPRNGPLVEELFKIGVDVQFMDLSLLSKTYLKKMQWGKILFPLFKFRGKKSIFNQYDLLYVNTSVILDFYLIAPFIRIKKIIHVREIPVKWLSILLSKLMKAANAKIIFNSKSTMDSFQPLKNSIVLHNAFEGFKSDVTSLPEDSLSPIQPLKILLIGRINSWKGQHFAINALSALHTKNYIIKIVGSVSEGNEDLLTSLKDLVKMKNMNGQVIFEDFASDPSSAYLWADVVVVPSIKPEPFGRVAIEAMSLGRPIIAAAHGGLPEIVDDNSSGYLFTPGNLDDFSACVLKYIENRQLLKLHGTKAYEIFRGRFSIDGFNNRVKEIFELTN